MRFGQKLCAAFAIFILRGAAYAAFMVMLL